MKNVSFADLVGKKVVALRGFRSKRRAKVTLQYILFDDKQTFLKLDEQCPITYHDCDSSARSIMVVQDKDNWKRMFDKYQHNNYGYDEPTNVKYLFTP